jgi:hypothetical protein
MRIVKSPLDVSTQRKRLLSMAAQIEGQMSPRGGSFLAGVLKLRLSSLKGAATTFVGAILSLTVVGQQPKR